jgi:small subunit ribosomal protein S9
LKEATAYGTGRRKESIARVWIKPGDGQVVVNDTPIEEYFTRYKLVKQALMPLNATQNDDKINVEAHTSGGGIAGQADALRHGLAMALVDMDEENRSILGPEGLLTRDPRVKERKHPFCRGARRRKQFSKR